MGCFEGIVTGFAAGGGAALLGAAVPVVALAGVGGYVLGYGCKYSSK